MDSDLVGVHRLLHGPVLWHGLRPWAEEQAALTLSEIAFRSRPERIREFREKIALLEAGGVLAPTGSPQGDAIMRIACLDGLRIQLARLEEHEAHKRQCYADGWRPLDPMYKSRSRLRFPDRKAVDEDPRPPHPTGHGTSEPLAEDQSGVHRPLEQGGESR